MTGEISYPIVVSSSDYREASTNPLNLQRGPGYPETPSLSLTLEPYQTPLSDSIDSLIRPPESPRIGPSDVREGFSCEKVLGHLTTLQQIEITTEKVQGA